MNQLSDITLVNSTIQGGTIYGANTINDSYSVMTFSQTSVINLGSMTITAGDLAKKLQLLDRIIADYCPEELI